MGGLLSKNSPGAQAASASQKKVGAEVNPTNANDADVTGGGDGPTVDIKKTVEQETESKSSVTSSDEKAVEVAEAETSSAVRDQFVETQPKDFDIVTDQRGDLTEDGDKLIATTDNIPDAATVEVDTTAGDLQHEAEQQQQEPADFTELSASDVVTELAKKVEDLHVVSASPQTDEQRVATEEIEQQPTVVSPDIDEATVETIQEARYVESVSNTTDEKNMAPSGADEQPAVGESILSDEIAVKLDSETGDVQKDE